MKRFYLILNIFISMNLFCLSSNGIVMNNLNDPQLNKNIEFIACNMNYDVIYYTMKYNISNHCWPNSKNDLLDFALKNSFQIDFTKYKSFSFEQCSEKRININYIIDKNKINDESNSIQDIKGIIGIYIEKYDDINLGLYNDYSINISYTISQNPYLDKNLYVLDGYSVHNYIEYYYEPYNKIRLENINKVPFKKIKDYYEKENKTH